MNWTELRSWWERHDGLDGGIRFLGAAAVVVTIEVLAGYYLWRGTTESVLIPPALGWALQFGLTGGSVVGTRAFHRGQSEDKWWGLGASVFAVLCVVVDASVAAMLLNGLWTINPGWLAVGVLVQCLVVGYLTVHTLMARPRAKTTKSTETTSVHQWSGPETVDLPAQPEPEPEPEPEPALEPALEPQRPQLESVGWSVDQIVADLHERGEQDINQRGIRNRYKVGPGKANKVLDALRPQEAAS